MQTKGQISISLKDFNSYIRHSEYCNRLHAIKNKIFHQVLSVLDSFERIVLEHKPFVKDNVLSDTYFLLDNLFLQLSSDEFEFLWRYRNEPI